VTKALTSIAPDHPELEAARASGVPLEAWQQIIADAAVSHGGRLVAIAGTHGKSTSSGWLLHVLAEAGRDPAGFVGALLPAALTGGIPATARWGGGDEFVVEADEYAGNFDPYRADLAIVLNAEWDHPDVFADEAAVLDAFEGWLTVPGADRRTVVINVGDAGAARLAERVEGRVSRVLRVRLDAEGDSSGAGDIVGRRSPDDSLLITGLESAPHAAIEAHLGLRGRHNAANALCVAAAASVLGVPGEAIARGLSTFRGVGRRLELKGEPLGVAIYDDYGHHPTAIAASIAALRERHPGRRLLAVYEPLTFHRTAAMLEQFADVMAGADEAFVADIWAGRDPDTTIASPVALADAINRHGRAHAAPTGSVEATADSLIATVREGDVVLVMGGGRSYVIAERLLEGLSTLAAGRGPVD
jgi:UDP-N-acetylmuramate--alanine ligase